MRRSGVRRATWIGWSSSRTRSMAIAITLLVIDLRLPSLPPITTEAELRSALADLAPRLFSFFLSFAVIGLWWTHASSVLRLGGPARWRRCSSSNLAFLGAIAFLPFPTSILGLDDPPDVGVALYAATNAVIGYVIVAMRAHRRAAWAASTPTVPPRPVPDANAPVADRADGLRPVDPARVRRPGRGGLVVEPRLDRDARDPAPAGTVRARTEPAARPRDARRLGRNDRGTAGARVERALVPVVPEHPVARSVRRFDHLEDPALPGLHARPARTPR